MNRNTSRMTDLWEWGCPLGRKPSSSSAPTMVEGGTPPRPRRCEGNGLVLKTCQVRHTQWCVEGSTPHVIDGVRQASRKDVSRFVRVLQAALRVVHKGKSPGLQQFQKYVKESDEEPKEAEVMTARSESTRAQNDGGTCGAMTELARQRFGD